ncbi:endonuclease VII domain-containing protein [Micromonospora sp. WMMA1363]|uniref:endonuclease VII domain-containing protein n=1 Tax=Micromonospora sp. WMMA1363 TaxID=3053985 RepID=UPI00259CDBE1|nr:endonuclease VII domain-containing protein [Micromonospora sp. WMMA1363]MDM4722765.1 endonuclease VII domain-containing protein [Micromonospora sp. WMMA1363]
MPMEIAIRQYEHERICKVEGCGRDRTAGGDGQHCQMHRKRVLRRGSAGGAERERAPFGQAEWSKTNIRRRKNLLDWYGMTIEEYAQLLVKQDGRCAVCRSISPGSNRARSDLSFCVDHDHVTGHVRGLLCQACNRAIGMLKDDPDIIEAAARYVRRHRQVPLFGPAGPKKKESSDA